MLKPPRYFKSKIHPSLANNKDLKSSNSEKVFPSFGLNNEKRVFHAWKIAGMHEASIQYAESIIKNLEILSSFMKEDIHCPYNNRTSSIDKIKGISNTIDTLHSEFDKNPDSFVSNKKFGLVIPIDIELDNRQYKAGTNLLKITKVLDRFCELSNGDDYYNYNDFKKIKSFHKKAHQPFDHFNSDDLNIVFSGNGERAQWDIATMSMRGIKSCQSWGKYHSKALIGSMVDPFAGIIYLEKRSKSNAYGSMMIRRSVVRIVCDDSVGNLSIFLERIYPFDYNSSVSDYLTLLAFANFFQERTDLPIIYGEPTPVKTGFERDFRDIGIPLTKPIQKLDPNYLSYRDSGINYYSVKNLVGWSKKEINKLGFIQ